MRILIVNFNWYESVCGFLFDADADPDPTCHPDADPDPTFHPDADPDPDPSFQIKA